MTARVVVLFDLLNFESPRPLLRGGGMFVAVRSSEAIAVGDDVGEEFSSMAAPSADEFRTRYPRTPLTCSEFKLLASC